MAWDLSDASYESSFDTPSAKGIDFNSDGTKMYIIRELPGTVYQYSLSTAWDTSTASYDDVSFSIDNEDERSLAIALKSDGTKMYMLGWTTDTVYQYSLSTAWNVGTASYDNVSFSVNSEESVPVAMYFKPDGTKMYISGQHGIVYQYSLTAWDLSTISYDSINFDVTGQDFYPYGIHLKPDGTKMYITGNQESSPPYDYAVTIYQYSLSTAWNVGTASYDNVSFGIDTTWYYDIQLNPDGTKFYVVDGDVYQYSLELVLITTLSPTLVENGIANLRLELKDKKGKTIHPVGWYCDENAAPTTEYIEIGWRAGIGGIDLALGVYSKYVKTLPIGYSTLYVQAWADDSNDNRYTGAILSFDIPQEAEYLEFPDIIFLESPDIDWNFDWNFPDLPPWSWDFPDLPPWVYWDFPELPPLPPWFLPDLPEWAIPDYPPMSFVGDYYYKKPYTRKDLEELRQKCINYEKNYTDFCLIFNHNTLLVKNFLQSAYNNGVLGGENEMFIKIYPSQQLTPLYLEPLEPNDFKGIINRFINSNTSNSMGLNHNSDLFTEWLNDYNYTSDGYKASYITPKEEIITNNEPTVKYLTGKINRLQREVSTASREIMHNFNLMKEIIQ